MNTLFFFWEGLKNEQLQQLQSQWIRLYPELIAREHNRASALQFINQHFDSRTAEAFEMCKPAAMQSDLFRVCSIVAKGGLYVDCATKPIKKLSVDIFNLDSKLILSRMETMRISNSFIAAKKEHPALLDILETIVNNIHGQSDQFGRPSNDVLWVTGPANYQHLRLPTNREVLNTILVEEDKIFERINDLPHKKNGKHWTELQKSQSIYAR